MAYKNVAKANRPKAKRENCNDDQAMSKIENQFAQTLKKSGLKFERNCRDLPGTPDVVFREQKLAVFFHGCFWHSHHCQKKPKSEEWKENLKEIKHNDNRRLNELASAGFQTMIVWECEWNKNQAKSIKAIHDRLYLSRSSP